MKTKHMVILKI